MITFTEMATRILILQMYFIAVDIVQYSDVEAGAADGCAGGTLCNLAVENTSKRTTV